MTESCDSFTHRLASLLPSELERTELIQLLSPRGHSLILKRRRATLIVNRVRMFAFLFAVLTPLWGLIDLAVFSYPLWMGLATCRLLACLAFICLLLFYRPRGNMLDAYRSITLLFAIPTLFYIASHTLLGEGQHLTGLSAMVATGYAFLPFVLMAGLAIFPLTVKESLILASVLLLAQGLAGYLNWATLNWPSFAGGFWLLALIAGVTALASISQLAFMIALVRQAVRDPLTGILSRGSGEEILGLQWSTARRRNTCLSLAFIDLDHFKTINDRFGHEAGDRALCESTQHMLDNLRGSDSLLRWGGEEFLLIMPDTDLQQARQALQRLLSKGLGHRPDGQPLTASIGLAERCFDGCGDYHALLELADRRMYMAKSGGRNQLCWQDEREGERLFSLSHPRP
ncbi:GGDEF domain-containing protein [Stutzerimonas kirkiae]|uniref:diguanylate cyclase n=1 Tax=Stutzerimonas kirkiae TaxID=2211392 RepID=A0A4Q9R0K7_9GAMM|nr:GGDEF domain-containing protein [Stutzerimonas kirkiae]TBU92186.1 GGDEF domain-containing protein [Stutzerimonas kirkiae]TBV01166.1 GGDEF domain-containing protein [Stutzerimonas kirkiae]TBV10469.1 GGDEF domain-containing protein [Stutzerimonas kirkiae]